LALIKSARSLEQDNSRELDEKINDIWPLITAAKGGKSCAAEETILRWLLKHMDGTTEAAEQLRRYPLTWTLLGCLFERISLFSLSKIFIERRFIVVLHQSAKDISNPRKKDSSKQAIHGKDSAKTRKRKREDVVTFDLEHLRSPEATVESAIELFGALNQLMSRLGVSVSSAPEDAMIGAEHVKALFRTPANEAQELTTPLLWICCQSLDVSEAGLSQDQQRWIEVLTDIWDLHLGSTSDPHEFAARLYYPCCSTLRKLQDIGASQGNQIVRQLWIQQLEQLLMKNLVNPARITFSNSQNLDLLEVANDAMLDPTTASVQTMWSLAVRTRHNAEDPLSKKSHMSWVQSVFTLLLGLVQGDESGDSIISPMLDIAIQWSCSPDLDTLRGLCKKYALRKEATNWPLLAKIVRSDFDAFLLDEEILSTVFVRITTEVDVEESEQKAIVNGVVNPLMKAFSSARDLTGFVERWYHQVSQTLKNPDTVSLGRSVWVDSNIRQQFAKLLQGALSTKQLSSLLDWLEQQNETNGASLVIIDAICDGITEEDFISSVSSRLFDSAFQHSPSYYPSELLALRWRIASATSTWVASDQTHEILLKIRSSLTEVLRKGVLFDPATFEAFNCCTTLCLAAHPRGKDNAELSELTCLFLQRLVTSVQTEVDAVALSNYLHLVFSRLSRLNEGFSEGERNTFEKIAALYHHFILKRNHNAEDSPRIHDLFQLVPENPDIQNEESSISILIGPIIDALDGSGTLCGWTQPKSAAIMSTMLSFPHEVFTRDRRKRIMSSWKKWKSVIETHGSSNAQYTEIVLRLLIVVMQQPTFYTVSSHTCLWVRYADISPRVLRSEIFWTFLRTCLMTPLTPFHLLKS
jgi:nucleolar pre-ribosomal-associated protein 2